METIKSNERRKRGGEIHISTADMLLIITTIQSLNAHLNKDDSDYMSTMVEKALAVFDR